MNILILTLIVKFVNSYLINNYNYKSLNFDNSNNNYSLFNDDYKTQTGIDMRFPNTTGTDTQALLILQENLKKLVLLSKLKNNDTSIQKKIDLINDSGFIKESSYVTTLHAGGLMDDFNHQF